MDTTPRERPGGLPGRPAPGWGPSPEPAGSNAKPAATEEYSASSFEAPVSSSELTGASQRGWLFAAIWLAYLSDSVKAAYLLDDPVRRVLGLAIVVVFAVVYVAVFMLVRHRRWHLTGPLPGWLPVVALSSLMALTVLGCVVIGEQAMAMTVYVSVTALLVLPVVQAWLAVCVLMAGVEVAARVVPGWSPLDGLTFSIFLASLAMWGITQMILRNRQLAVAQDEIARMAVTAERTRFARDLHDLLGHSLTVITIKAELAGRLVSLDPQRAAQEISEVENLARDALADVRGAVAGYREMSLAAELISARTALDAAGIQAELPGALDEVPGPRRELFGWALREGVTNVVRHSGATRCRVEVSPSAIEIVDDGIGPAAASGAGLAGLAERADAAGATLTAGRAQDGGFRLRVGW